MIGINIEINYYYVNFSLCNTESSRFLSAREIAQNQKPPKNFPVKSTSQYAWRGEESRDWAGLKDFALSWWIGPRFFDAGEICEYKQLAIKPYKMMAKNWTQVTQKKQPSAQICVSTIYFYIYAYISNI